MHGQSLVIGQLCPHATVPAYRASSAFWPLQRSCPPRAPRLSAAPITPFLAVDINGYNAGGGQSIGPTPAR
ncbi:MAG: hypothetical protein ABI972_05390 [Acidobacteriota bacterium]